MPETTQLLSLIEKHWGYRTLRPLQEQAMQAVLARRDSLVVMPTGGGKSLCFQAPALTRPAEVTVVISPLIALMKDQVDSLRSVGVNARFVNSTLTETERVATFHDLKAGKVPLLFTSPERLAMQPFQEFLTQMGVRTFAIDEAHCISHWGHDFRPEYRQLTLLRERYPTANVHGYTATATPQVRDDIVKQLGLKDPEVLIGNFDRPNLFYRVVPRSNEVQQVMELLRRHDGEAGIVYCIRRKDVDVMAAQLKLEGFNVMPYHAGLTPEERKQAQDAFRSERCDIVVATVAFGMGIDRSNVRFVVHTGMPKSIEHYQQEAGRAGRDGLEAECVLLASGQDFKTWEFILNKSSQENEVDADFLPAAMAHLKEMMNYSKSTRCRHRLLVEHFGQRFDKHACQACDVCTGDREFEPEGQEIARKILSCVARVEERYGIGYVVNVLHGDNDERIIRNGHQELTTFGLLKDRPAAAIRDFTRQLLDQELLVQEGDEYPILKLTAGSWAVMRNQKQIKLVKVTKARAGEGRKPKAGDGADWEGVDRPLFDALKIWRRAVAEEKNLPPYVIFGDATLRELARVRPTTREGLLEIYGIGEAKLREYGDDLLEAISDHCRRTGLSSDLKPAPKVQVRPNPVPVLTPTTMANYFERFRRGETVEQVCNATGHTDGTIWKYLGLYFSEETPDSIARWITPEAQALVLAKQAELKTDRLKPIFEGLGEQVSYNMIRGTLTYAKAMGMELEVVPLAGTASDG